MDSRKKLVLDNLVFGLQRNGGGSTYWQAIVKGAQSSGNWETQFYEPKNAHLNICRSEIKIAPNSITQINLTAARFKDVHHNSDCKFVFHSSYYRISSSRRAVNIITVHDFIAENFFKGFRRLYHHWRKSNAVKYADAIICVSHSTYRDLRKWIPTSKIKPTFVIHNGVNEIFRLSNDERASVNDRVKQATRRCILFVGHRTQYKNFPVAIETVKNLPDNYILRIVGAPTTLQENKMLEAKIPGRFEVVVRPGNEELRRLYQNSYCLLYPSSYEGFGIPLLEAMCMGCPVVASRNSAIPEILGGGGVVTPEINATAFSTAVLRLNDAKFRLGSINKGMQQSAKFSWSTTWKETEKIYLAAIEAKSAKS